MNIVSNRITSWPSLCGDVVATKIQIVAVQVVSRHAFFFYECDWLKSLQKGDVSLSFGCKQLCHVGYQRNFLWLEITANQSTPFRAFKH